MVLPYSHKISRVPWYSGLQPKAFLFHLQDYHLLWWVFPDLFNYNTSFLTVVSATPIKQSLIGLGFSPFARRYLGNRVFFLFLEVLRCFSSLGMPSTAYVFSRRYLRFTLSGFPHSEISGSKSTCDSPKHIGAYPVLRRLLVPRHSPYALNNLTSVTLVLSSWFVVVSS